MNKIGLKNKSGFTLIELLIVIAIVGIMSTLTIVSLDRAKSKARDARRLSDITQIQKALEVYYYSEDKYPDMDEGFCTYGLSSVVACNSLLSNPTTAWIPSLTTYLEQPLPIDPINSLNGNYFYLYSQFSQGSGYYLLFRLETQDQTNECEPVINNSLNWSCKKSH